MRGKKDGVGEIMERRVFYRAGWHQRQGTHGTVHVWGGEADGRNTGIHIMINISPVPVVRVKKKDDFEP